MANDTVVTTTISGATFSDGATLSGSFTAEYDAAGTLDSVDMATFTVSLGSDTTVFSLPGTLPYADPTADGTYEIRFGGVVGGTFTSLYLDYLGETPSAAATTVSDGGTYTSVLDGSGTATLVSGGAATDVPCYLAGTLILTVAGEVPVEQLTAGDLVVTHSGAQRPIRWIGRRDYAGRFLAANPRLRPIRFRQGCLGAGLPRRDLLVSPGHAMFVDGMLVPARCLVDGDAISQERALDRVAYFHVELDSHDILLAEGAAAESFLDDDSRRLFHNAADAPAGGATGGFCAPVVDCGFSLERIRQRLAA